MDEFETDMDVKHNDYEFLRETGKLLGLDPQATLSLFIRKYGEQFKTEVAEFVKPQTPTIDWNPRQLLPNTQ